MPLNMIQITEDSIDIYIDDIALLDKVESLRLLRKRAIDFIHYNKITNDSKQKQWLGCRLMLHKIFTVKEDIVYGKNGEPFLKFSDKKISLSHSDTKICIAINNKDEVGIDIQRIDEKAIIISKKFLNSEEQNRLSLESSKDFCIAWSIKEACFKACRRGDLFLKEHFSISDLTKETATCIVKSANIQKEFMLKYQIIDDYVVAYTLNG